MTKTLAGAAAVLALILVGCGGGGSRASVSPGAMPSGGNFTGVWFSPQYGEMHMVQTGSQVVGEYTKDERRGRLQGTVQGDLMRFQWEEQREMVQGRPLVTRGRGYFQYSIGPDGDHYIQGEWGHDDNELGGGPWNGVKSRNRRPQLSTDRGRSGGGEDEYGDDGSGEMDDSGDTDGDSGGEGGGDLEGLDSI